MIWAIVVCCLLWACAVGGRWVFRGGMRGEEAHPTAWFDGALFIIGESIIVVWGLAYRLGASAGLQWAAVAAGALLGAAAVAILSRTYPQLALPRRRIRT